MAHGEQDAEHGGVASVAPAAAQPAESTPSQPTTRRRRRGLSAWWHLLIVLVVLALVQSFLVKAYQVPSGSMEQTLQVGDRILVNRLAYLGGGPARGDVVTFVADDSWDGGAHDEPFTPLTAVKWVAGLFGFGPGTDIVLVKRVIGLPGDAVSCCDDQGRVLVNGEPLDEPYLHGNLPFETGTLDCSTTSVSGRCFGEIDVPDDAYLMLGDHRANSADSVVACRGTTDAADCARFVHREQVVGRAFFVLWPIGRLGAVG